MNTYLTLKSVLILAGIGHFGILIASALTPFVLDWKSVLKPLPPMVRHLFWVYGFFIVLTIIGLGTLTLLNVQAMAEGEPVARSLAAFIGIFWTARLAVQLFLFDAKPYLTNRWLKLGYHSLTGVFLFFSITYFTAAFNI